YQTETNAVFYQPLIPRHKIGFQYHGNFRNTVNFSFYAQHYSFLFVNDKNDEKTSPQTNLQLMLNTGSRVSERYVVGLHLQNLFDLNTISNIRANAAGGRYYEAASPFGVNLFVQVRIFK